MYFGDELGNITWDIFGPCVRGWCAEKLLTLILVSTFYRNSNTNMFAGGIGFLILKSEGIYKLTILKQQLEDLDWAAEIKDDQC